MIRRELSELAVYSIQEDADTIAFDCLRKFYLEKTSEIIYIIKNEKLYGIICMGEVLYGHIRNEQVRINKSFTALEGYDVIKAHEIFHRRGNINKIPVVTRQGELIGEYSRWDDMFYIQRNQELLMREVSMKGVLQSYDAIYLIKPVKDKQDSYLYMVNSLDRCHICYRILEKERIGEILLDNSICIFADEDEKRGMQCLYGVEPYIYDSQDYNVLIYDQLADKGIKVRFATYKSLLFQIREKILFNALNMRKPRDLSGDRIDDKADVLLSELKEKGVKCFVMYALERERTQYGQDFCNKINMRLQTAPIDCNHPWPKREENETFYDELYVCKDYQNETAQQEIFDGNNRLAYQKDIYGKYFNARNGKRITCFQPENYIGTIYLMGPCSIIGLYAEDQYTISSYLQKILLERGYKYRVENCGQLIRPDSAIDVRLREIEKFHKNDIIVYQSTKGEALNLPGISLEKIFEENQIPVEWVTNVYGHCNHKANKLIAESILEMILPNLLCGNMKNQKEEIQIDIPAVMEKYVQNKYLSQYFADFNWRNYASIGAIVMNCNPFSSGHRYLIEEARKGVEFLIVFVVEEDASLFPFEERFRLVQEGTKDIEGVMVVPSGEFILSKNNVREYFSKEQDEAITHNAEYDIQVFADYIAKPLHITYRFAGEEPEDRVTNIYNSAMENVLPQRGIQFVQIPRKKIQGQIISASKVRKYLGDGEYEKAFMLVPQTTKVYLMNQTGVETKIQ